MIKVIGQEGITAKILAHSITEAGHELLTYELEYPRFILSEVNTHRMLSKNSASSRAIPVKKVLELTAASPAMPVHWGKNQPGMSADEELSNAALAGAKAVWVAASVTAMSQVKVLDDIGLHKQVSNRILEPWARMKTIVSGTEWTNWFWLRNHDDAQPEIRALARIMLEAKNKSTPILLHSGEWHLPYISRVRYLDRPRLTYFTLDEEGQIESFHSLEDARKISIAACAQVSYRKNDLSLEKADKIISMLNIGSKTKPVHASPCEHQATPMTASVWPQSVHDWEYGVTHQDRDCILWSGNFKGFIQYRQLLEAP